MFSGGVAVRDPALVHDGGASNDGHDLRRCDGVPNCHGNRAATDFAVTAAQAGPQAFIL